MVFPKTISDAFDVVEHDRFDLMRSHARQRWLNFVEVRTEPVDCAQWAVALLSTDFLKMVSARDRVLYVFDAKCNSDSLVPTDCPGRSSTNHR